MKKITKHMFVYTLPRQQDRNTAVFSSLLKEAKMLDLAYNVGLLFLGEQGLLRFAKIYKFSSSFIN